MTTPVRTTLASLDDVVSNAGKVPTANLPAASGDGSALTNLTAANIAAGTAPIGVTGNAATATALATTYGAGTLLGGQGTGVPAAVTVGSGLALSAGTLTASGGSPTLGPGGGYVYQNVGGTLTGSHVNFGFVWPDNVSLGTGCWWDFWVAPQVHSADGIVAIDGYGGTHAMSVSFPTIPGPQAAQFYDGSSVIQYGGTYSVNDGEWINFVVAWDGSHLLEFVNGICDGYVPMTARHSGPYGSGCGVLYIGGADHQNGNFKLAAARAWDRSNPRTNQGSFAFVPSRTFFHTYSYQSTLSSTAKADWICDFTVPGALIDSSSNGVSHTNFTGVTQTLSQATGTVTAGTFTMTFGGQTATGLAFNSTAAQIQTALGSLSSVGAPRVWATGGPLPGTPVTVHFEGSLAKDNQPAIAVDSTGLTGGTYTFATVETHDPLAKSFHHGNLYAPQGAFTDIDGMPGKWLGPLGSWLVDVNSPYGAPIGSPLPNETPRSPGAAPAGSPLAYDTVGRRNQTPAYQAVPTLGSTEGGSVGVKAWVAGYPTGSTPTMAAPFGILGGYIRNLENTYAIEYIDLGAQNHEVQFDRNRLTYAPDEIGVSVRVTDANNWWGFYFSSYTGGNLLYYGKTVAGTMTYLDHLSPGTTWTTLRVVTKNNGDGTFNITCYVDNGAGGWTALNDTTKATLTNQADNLTGTKAGFCNSQPGINLSSGLFCGTNWRAYTSP